MWFVPIGVFFCDCVFLLSFCTYFFSLFFFVFFSFLCRCVFTLFMCVLFLLFFMNTPPPPFFCSWRSSDTPFILSFAIIMLNTDLHRANAGNGKRRRRRMSKEEFINNLRCWVGGGGGGGLGHDTWPDSFYPATACLYPNPSSSMRRGERRI